MSLDSLTPEVYHQLLQAGEIAERHLRDVADIEFTVQHGQLFVNHIRPGRMPPLGQLRVQLRLLTEGLINPEQFLERIRPAEVAAFVRPEIADKTRLRPLGKGLEIGGGAATGKIVFSALAASQLGSANTPSLLVVREWGGEALRAAEASVGVLATTGGISSHAAMMCRHIGKPCVVGFRSGVLSREERVLRVPGFSPVREGDWLTVDGTTGDVFAGQAQVETRPWESHPELVQLSLIVEQAAASGHVPAKCAGTFWRIWDFMRHGLPLADKVAGIRKGKETPWNYPRSALRELAAARQTVQPIDHGARVNYSEIILGLMTALERQLRRAAGGCQPYCRVLWDPQRQVHLPDASQMVGFEFFDINRRISHLIEIAELRFLIECEVQSPGEAWVGQNHARFGIRMVPKSGKIKACRILVNGAALEHEDIPKFYTWLRRREYFWSGLADYQPSPAELATFLKRFARTGRHEARFSVLCRELGLLGPQGLTVAGKNLAGLMARR